MSRGTAYDMMREALAEQQEPVFWYRPCSNGMYEGPIHNAQIERVRKESGAWHPLYTSPPANRTWVGLTDEEIDEWTPEIHSVIRAIEAKLEEKNA